MKTTTKDQPLTLSPVPSFTPTMQQSPYTPCRGIGSSTLLNGIEIHLPPPDRVPSANPYIDWDGTLGLALTAVQQMDDLETLHVCFTGPTGCGKTERARLVAQKLNLASYTLQGHPLLTPEDTVLSPVLTSLSAAPRYVGSPILAAFMDEKPAVAIFDEIGKAGRSSEDALAPLASALDMRKTLFSSMIQQTFEINPKALFIATAQTDEILPEYITSRMVVIPIAHPPAEILMEIVRVKCPYLTNPLADAYKDWLCQHPKTSTRKGILHLNYAVRLFHLSSHRHPSSKTLMSCIETAATYI